MSTPGGRFGTGGLPRAAFLDRDGTIIRDHGYVDDPLEVELLSGSGAAIARLNELGVPVVEVTNQSGIGRGLYGEEDFRAVQREVERQLAAAGGRLDGVFHCPHDPEVRPPCGCRKPALGMYRRAARRLGLELEGALYVGDRLSDVLPAKELDGTGILVLSGQTKDASQVEDRFHVAEDLRAAVAWAVAAYEAGTG